MSSTAPMFLELEQEERERELLETISEEPFNGGDQQMQARSIDCKKSRSYIDRQQLDLRGGRVLLAAEKNRLFELVRYIHDEPTIVNYTDHDGYTPLHRASYSGNLDCVKYLLRHRANLEARTKEDWRPLHSAVRWNNLEVAEYLLSQGADVNALSSGGNTPLHLAASNGRYSLTCDIIQLLLFHPNCDYTLKNHSGDTAYDIAKRGGPFYKLWSGVMTICPDDSMPVMEDGVVNNLRADTKTT